MHPAPTPRENLDDNEKEVDKTLEYFKKSKCTTELTAVANGPWGPMPYGVTK